MKKRPHKNLVGLNVKKHRQKQGLSQEQFAAKCQRQKWDIGRDTIAKIELLNRRVTDIELIKLAKALKISPNELLSN